jgi:penicillin V acylase-like amidase (Ntn superfamily)
MKRLIAFWRLAVATLFCVLLGIVPTHACTTFVLQGADHVYFGRGFAWYSEDAQVIVNPRGVQKSSLVFPRSTPAKWVSKYGSVTFNSGGWELPTGGMNETGLVVENMWLDQTQWPAPDSRPALNSLQWIQYQLDNCRTVDEVIASDKDIRVEAGGLPVTVHYLVCDAAGNSAVIEFLNGKTVVHRGEGQTCRALANEPYARSADEAAKHPLTSKPLKPLRGDPPYERFKRASARTAAFQPGTPEADLKYAFETLKLVNQGRETKWEMVYDLTGRKIHYRTLSHPKVRVLDLTRLDFTCRGPVKFFRLRSPAGDQPQPKFETMTEAKLRRYAGNYLTQRWVKYAFGDMTPFMEAMLINVRGYRATDPVTGREFALLPEAEASEISAADILRQSIEARGGKDAAVRIQSYQTTGTLHARWQTGATSGPFETFCARPDKYRDTAELKSAQNFKGGRYDQGTDGRIAWEAQPGEPCKQLEGAALQQLGHIAQFFAGIDDLEDCLSATNLGLTLFDGKKCHVIALVKKSGEQTTHYFDAKTLRLTGEVLPVVVQNAPVWVKVSHGRYKKFEGFAFATRSKSYFQRSTVEAHIATIKINAVDNAVFTMPVAASVPKL